MVKQTLGCVIVILPSDKQVAIVEGNHAMGVQAIWHWRQVTKSFSITRVSCWISSMHDNFWDSANCTCCKVILRRIYASWDCPCIKACGLMRTFWAINWGLKHRCCAFYLGYIGSMHHLAIGFPQREGLHHFPLYFLHRHEEAFLLDKNSLNRVHAVAFV